MIYEILYLRLISILFIINYEREAFNDGHLLSDIAFNYIQEVWTTYIDSEICIWNGNHHPNAQVEL